MTREAGGRSAVNRGTGEIVQLELLEGDTLQGLRKPPQPVRYDWRPHPGRHVNVAKRLRDAGWLELVYTVGRLSFYRVGSRVWDLATTEDQDEDQSLAPVHHLRPRGVYATE